MIRTLIIKQGQRRWKSNKRIQFVFCSLIFIILEIDIEEDESKFIDTAIFDV